MIVSMLPKNLVNSQAQQLIADLTKDAEAFEKELQEQRSTLNSYQVDLDRINREFYNEFRSEYKVSNLISYLPIFNLGRARLLKLPPLGRTT